MIIWMEQVAMQFLIWLLGLIDGIMTVFNTAAGIENIVNSEGKEMSLASYFINLQGVQKAFWIILIASVVICGVCTIAAIVKNTVNMKGGEGKSHGRTIAQSISAIFIALFVALFFATGVGVTDQFLRLINKQVNGGEAPKMSHKIIEVSVSETYIMDTKNLLKLNKYDGDECTYMSYLYYYVQQSDTDTTPATYTDYSGYESCIQYYTDATKQSIFEPYMIYTKDDTGGFILDTSLLTPQKKSSGWRDEELGASCLNDDILQETFLTIFGTSNSTFGIPTTWKYNGKINPDSFNFVIAYLCAIIVLIALVMATLGLVKRLYDIVFLFITLPGITATIPLDDGAKFKLWRETVISKLFLAFGSVIAINVFYIVAPSIWSINISAASPFLNALFKVILICGGALTISGGQLLFARLLGTSAEESREMGQSARTLMGSAMTVFGLSKATGRLLFGTKNANGQRVGGLIKGGAGALGAVGGGAVNAVGSTLGGQAYRNSKFGLGVSATQKALRGFSQSSGWFGKDRTTGENTLGGAIGSALASGADKFAESGIAQNSGLDRGLIGGMHKLGQSVGSKISMEYSTKLDKESSATARANDIAEAFGVSPYAVKHVKEKKK